MLKFLSESSKYGTGVSDLDGTKEYSLMGLNDSHCKVVPFPFNQFKTMESIIWNPNTFSHPLDYV